MGQLDRLRRRHHLRHQHQGMKNRHRQARGVGDRGPVRGDQLGRAHPDSDLLSQQSTARSELNIRPPTGPLEDGDWHHGWPYSQQEPADCGSHRSDLSVVARVATCFEYVCHTVYCESTAAPAGCHPRAEHVGQALHNRGQSNYK